MLPQLLDLRPYESRDWFDRAVILFDQIVEVLPLPDLDFGNGMGIDLTTYQFRLNEICITRCATLVDRS